ncbi:MAG: diguanylate cyclase (GGDEF)-like protein [Desulforhopalus sp.]|jgi:diguanylate cyclase (GGDEF)-like protein
MSFRIFSSLRYRIALSIFALEAMMMVLVLGQTLTFSHESTKGQLRENEQVILSLLADLSQTALFSMEFSELQQYMDKVTRDPHILRVMVSNFDGLVVISTHFSDVGKNMPSFLGSTEEKFWQTKELNGFGSIAIQFSNAELLAASHQVTKLGITIALSGMAVIALAGLGFGFLLTRRLSVLIEAAGKLADGDLGARTHFEGRDEISIVGQTFDYMVIQVKNTISKLEKQQKELSESKDELERRVQERTSELKQLNYKLLQLAELDALTQLPNRRRFDAHLTQELGRAHRSGSSLSLLLLDIDYFKLFNDHFGHLEGDECLVTVATAINQVSTRRVNDLAARYGGEEFVVTLPETDLAGALVVAENIRKKVEGLHLKHPASKVNQYVTISIGVAIHSKESSFSTPEELIRKADRALYAAKRQGRNQFYVQS